MIDRSAVEAWVHRYVNAWRSNDPERIGDLFAHDARYYTAPYREPWAGRDTIVRAWLERKDQPGSWTFRSQVLGTDGDVGFVRGWTEYSTGHDYSNLWVIRLTPEGRCSEFVEWWMEVGG